MLKLVILNKTLYITDNEMFIFVKNIFEIIFIARVKILQEL